MKIQLFELTKCGFYEAYTDDKDPEIPSFGQTSEWWEEFSNWVGGADYKQTSTFSRSHEPERVYCIGRTTDSIDNYGVALWNVAPSMNGRAFHLPPSGLVDDVQPDVADVEEGSTAGWPSYFWLMPAESVMVGLIPSSLRGSGIPHAREYFYRYLKERSGYCRPEGYNRPGFSTSEPFVPRFVTRSLRRAGEVEEIASKWNQIRKYVSNTSFDPPSIESMSNSESRLRSWIPDKVKRSHLQDSSRKKERTYRLEADWIPESKEAVQEVFSSWEDYGFDDNNWAGVRTKDGKLYRFDEMICREPLEIESQLDRDPRWDVETLERIWSLARPSVQELLHRTRNSGNVTHDNESREPNN